MNNYSILLLRFAALFGLVGVFLGSHMAGAGSYAFRPVHAHALVVGWLSLFAWAVYYKVFHTKKTKLAIVQVWSAIIGAVGLTLGMWLHMVQPFDLPTGVTLPLYIGGGSALLLSYVVFFLMAFFYKEEK